MMMEKALPAKRRRAAKGTVLFTVVAVMMVLIVFLMGTLALAATANKRAQRNYQKEQTEYTARAVLDSVIQKINEDTTGTGLKRDIADGTVSSLTVTIDDGSPNPPTQTVSIQKLMNGTSEATHGIYTGATDGWKDVPLYMLSVNIASSTTSAETTYTAFVTAGLHTSTGSGSGNGGGGAFVSMGDLTTEIGTGGYITGGSYVGLGNTTMNNFTVGNSGDSTIDAPMYVNGNLDFINNFTIHFSTSEQFLSIMGDFAASQEKGFICNYDGYSSTDSAYENVPSIYVGGTLKLGQDPDDLSGKNTPYQIGSDTVPTNVFADRFILTASNDSVDSYIHGDVYGFDPNQTNCISAVNNVTHAMLYKWASSNIKDKNNQDRYFGNLYSAGNLKLNTNGNGNLEIEGDVRCAKDVVVGGKGAKVDGDLVVAGTLTVNSPLEAKNIYASKIVNNSSINCTSAHAFATEGGAVNNFTQFTGGQRVIGNATVTKTVTYENVTLTQNLINGGSAAEAVLTYDTVTTGSRRVGGVDTALPEERVPTRTQINLWNVPWPESQTYNVEQYINAGLWADYEAMKTAYNNYLTAPPATTTTNEDIVEYDFGAVYSGVVYPADYEMSKMPDAVFKVPEASKYRANYFTKVDGTPGYGNTLVNTSGAYVPTVYTNASYTETAYTGADPNTKLQFLEIKNSCVLQGTMNKGNIYINPGKNNPITVVLDNFVMNEDGGAGKIMMIVNDESQVTFFVRGNCSLKCEGLFTQDYLEMFTGKIDPSKAEADVTHYTEEELVKMRGSLSLSTALTIPQEVDPDDEIESRYLPNVIIYGEGPDTTKGINRSELSLDGNNVVLTAQVRAPEMDFHQNMGKQSDITYKKANGATKTYNSGDNCYIGVIGQLIANKITLGNSAKWGLIYVTQPDKRCAACKAAGCTACNGASSCTCTEPTCTCHSSTPTPPPTPTGNIDFAENFNVLYYNMY